MSSKDQTLCVSRRECGSTTTCGLLSHRTAVITLRTYAHMWPGDEDRTRNVLDAALSVLEHNPRIIRTVDGQRRRRNSVIASEARKPQAAFLVSNYVCMTEDC